MRGCLMNISEAQFKQELEELERSFNNLAPELEITVRDPLLGVEGFVVVWNTPRDDTGDLAPFGKGGTRITPATSLNEIKMLARIMALKNAAAGLPIGGAKSGLCDDPNSEGFERRLRRYAQLVSPLLVERGGIWGGFGFDIGVKPQHAEWVCDELKSFDCFTGKSIEQGGTDYDREGIAGFGVSEAAACALESEGTSVQGATFAVQGAGAMGAAIVRFFGDAGGVLKAIADPSLGGCWTFPKGASEEFRTAIAEHHLDRAKNLAQEEGTSTALEAVLGQEVDVLFPAAVQDVITMDTVATVKARIVVEGANSPCKPPTRTVLHDRGVLVLPDFIVNSGGIIAAFVEMTSNVSNEENKKSKKKVLEAKATTRAKVRDNVTQVLNLTDSFRLEPSVAARYLALTRIFASI